LDVLVDVFRLLPPRNITISRCVCTSWRAAIDDHNLLRGDLLLLDAVIFTTIEPSAPKLFSRPSTRREIIARVDDQNMMSPYVLLEILANIPKI
jgi:hypothetical protein